MAKEADDHTISNSYVITQLAKALQTIVEHPEPAVRQRAELKLEKWTAVFRGIMNGLLRVGSRTPVADTPAWATLEVATGGFATGKLLAEGPLAAHEMCLLAERAPDRPIASPAAARGFLNASFLSDEGIAQLQEQLHSGRFEIDVPEEGALLVIAWLLEHGHVEAARDLLDALGAYLPRLRFYPAPADAPQEISDKVFLRSVGQVASSLATEPHPRILAQKEAIEIWAPLYDRMVRLLLETVEGETPRLVAGSNAVAEGGRPGQRLSSEWTKRARAWLAEYAALRPKHKFCEKPDDPKGNFSQLRAFLTRCVETPASLEEKHVARARVLLARSITRYDEPGSPRMAERRNKQAEQVRGPTFQQIALLLIERLKDYPQREGLTDLAPAMRPLSEDEARRLGDNAGRPIPPSMAAKIERALCATVDVLVERGIISSGDTLAVVIPQLTAGLRAAGIADADLRRLYAAIYRAFRRRRSLLLVNLESQVKIEELPWVAAIEALGRDSATARDATLHPLREIARMTLSAFPQAIIPNKLLQEFRALAKSAFSADSAESAMPMLDELAADIFMGTFTEKFVTAGKDAAELLKGTLYETYYSIDYQEILDLEDRSKTPPKLRRSRDDFAAICFRRAGVSATGRPAVNGTIIEQQQILTTQNLATLFYRLGLDAALRDRLPAMAQKCFAWICRRQQLKIDRRHAKLLMVKNTAYAWRQMIFYLSLVSADERAKFLAWAREHLSQQTPEFQQRFEPAMAGLDLAAQGKSPDKAKQFLGWSVEKHWLLA